MSCQCSNNKDKNDKTSCCSTKKCGGMSKFLFIIIVIIIASVIIYSKKTSASEANVGDSASAQSSITTNASLPTMLELGAEKCVPCKMMKPIIETLQKNYSDSLNVLFYDVWKNPEMGEKFKIQIIPVQVFLDKDGKEIFRHEGFYSKDDILEKFKELGYKINPNK